jgi:NAD(P)-dependent dehydrogenase (short-subunit alcohol dehydrogenase family)/rhamnose utilization protein RhaD (predicted bifunctional aldolase and dehydrogenase)
MPGSSWIDTEAGASIQEQLVYAMQQLSQGQGWSLRAGGFASIKTSEPDLFGQDQPVLYFACSQDQPAELVCLHLGELQKLTNLVHSDQKQLENALAATRLDASLPVPDQTVLLHALLPGKCILNVRLDALLAILFAGDGPQQVQKVFKGQIAILEDGLEDRSLSRAWIEAALKAGPGIQAVLYGRYDLAVMGDSPRSAFENLLAVQTRAVEYLQTHYAWEISTQTPLAGNRPHRSEIAALRKALSEAAGCPLILTLDEGPLSLAFAQRQDLDASAAAPGISSGTLKSWPLIGKDLVGYLDQHQLARGQAAPRLILDKDLGMAVSGRNPEEAMASLELYLQAFTAIQRAETLQGSKLASVYQVLAEVVPGFYFDQRYDREKLPQFTGEIALVTGGASGIGKACVESLMQRGAAVVTMDINPKVTTQYEKDAYLGQICDLTDEDAMLACYDAFVRRFGGLDMLVLNAGIFPAGVRIEALDTATWQKVMRINLDSNLVVMREAQPLLSQAPCYGRVLVNASKNVLAPGAGAAAYSASKAAVTQLARVAALEWGKDHIRVNMIHPDAIFDTGIWSEEVLKARAAHYGMTVQQYKTRNVLGVELNSHYVGELVAEMLGPLFEKITGAQIPVDGGSDRVI